MAITVGTSTVTSGNAGSAPTLVINSGVATGDLLILCVTVRDSTTDPTVDDNDTGTHNEWAKFTNQNASGNGAGTIWYKFATSVTAGKTITITAPTGYGSCSAGVIPFSGCSLTRTFTDTTAVSEANASGNETQAQINVGMANSMVCLATFDTSNDVTDTATYACATDPASLTEQFEGVSTTGNDCSVHLASALKTTTGYTGAFTWAQTDGTTASIAFAIAPELSPTTVLGTPNDDATGVSTTPALKFTGTDINQDLIDYQVEIASTTTFENTYTYYFDASDNSTPGTPTDSNGVWANDNSAFDGDTGTSASATTNGSTSTCYLLGEGTTAPASGETIVGVRARIYGNSGYTTYPNDRVNAAIYTDGLGELLGTASNATDGAWGSYTTLTTPSGGWSWAKLQALETKVYIVRSGGSKTANRVEIEVTTFVGTVNAYSTDQTGFSAGASHPTASGVEQTYTVQSALDAGTKYYWRVRGVDPSGSNTWGAWSPGAHTGYSEFTTEAGTPGVTGNDWPVFTGNKFRGWRYS